jgi:hypothetical protein
MSVSQPECWGNPSPPVFLSQFVSRSTSSHSSSLLFQIVVWILPLVKFSIVIVDGCATLTENAQQSWELSWYLLGIAYGTILITGYSASGPYHEPVKSFFWLAMIWADQTALMQGSGYSVAYGVSTVLQHGSTSFWNCALQWWRCAEVPI